MITNSSGSPIKEHTFDDSFLFFGSTGLIGSLTLKNFLDVNLYYCSTQELQAKLDKPSSQGIYNFTLNKTFYCLNRQFDADVGPKNDGYVAESRGTQTKQLIYGKQPFFLRNNSSSSPPESQSSNISLMNKTFEEDGIITIRSTFDTYEKTVEYRMKKRKYELEFKSNENKILSITLQFFIIEIVIADSSKWGELLPHIFCGESKLVPNNGRKSYRQSPLPEMNLILNMVCTLGSNSNKAEKSRATRYYVDYNLTFQLVKKFVTCEGKRLVIITTFNNELISHLFPYFKTKSKLEYDLQNRIVPKLTQLIIVRPGPLIGSHVKETRTSLTLERSSYFPKQLLLYKRLCWEYKKMLFREIRQVGIKTKASEIIAKTMYHKPGSWLLGYCIPASKVALVVAMKAVEPSTNSANFTPQFITSEQIDHMV